MKLFLLGAALLATALTVPGLASPTAQGVPIRQTTLPTRAAAARPVPALAERWMRAWNTGDARGMAALFTEDGVYEDFAFQGRAGVAQWVEITVRNIPDARGEIIDAVGSGDRLAVRWVFTGTPRALGPVTSTGKSFAVPVVSFFELRGGRIARVGDYYNVADVLRQLGLPAGIWTPPAP